ncbi:hypothetical protein HPULCUR_007452 [Helicostylum pulchrum]|uniref:Uncharacterized protein n=1 Tax=Helicostylum pulchrum TaxID=562976 RepID=A0ABP9Y4T3_9FUNG
MQSDINIETYTNSETECQSCGLVSFNAGYYARKHYRTRSHNEFISITDSGKRKKSKIPKMKKEIYSVTKGDQVYEMTLNKPSDFIKLLLCNPEKGKKISCLPDRTPEIRISLNQGHKWLYDSEFRCPMIVGDGSSRDLWIGDILKVQSIDSISSELYMRNTTKKWNCYDSWIMTPAALPLKDRNMYENQFFLCTHHNLNAMDTASRLVEDLKSLEDGMVMYDLEYDEEVLVYAPVLFITGDNVRHSEICCSKGSRSTCPCRKCFWQLDPPQPKNRPVTPVRTRLQDYVAAPRFKMYSVMYAIDELPKLPAPGVTLRNRGRGVGRNPNESTPGQEDAWDKLGYKKTGGEVFLQLKAFDPTKDTPVEMLHLIMGEKATNKKYVSASIALAFAYFKKDHPSIVFSLKDSNIKGYSDSLSAACVVLATTYLNHIVENFKRRVLYYLSLKLSMIYPDMAKGLLYKLAEDYCWEIITNGNPEWPIKQFDPVSICKTAEVSTLCD